MKKGETSIEIIDALVSTHNYFIALQARYLLTPKDERVWKKVSKALDTLKYFDETKSDTSL